MGRAMVLLATEPAPAAPAPPKPAAKVPAAPGRPAVGKKSATRHKKPGQPSGTTAALKKANILMAIGATGSGKSTRVKADIERLGLRRLMVWDWMREYDEYPAFTSMDQLARHVAACPEFAVRFLPSYDKKTREAQFDLFCRLAMAVGDMGILCEELSQVVRANGGGAGWTQVLTAGRHKGLHVYGTSQRPALVDKTALSQATRLYCGNLELPDDVEIMGKMLGVAPAEIQALGPWDYIEKHRETKTLHRGNLSNGPPK